MNKNLSIENILVNIKEAYNFLTGVVHRTPLNKQLTLSNLVNANVYLKLENLQKTGSFKVRGAYYAINKKNQRSKIELVVAASSGNHAQGVAYSASQLGINSIIVMPKYTPIYKVEATKNYGAKVLLYGETYDDAYHKAIEISQERNSVFIHPFNDLDVIAGQGTIGVEIYEDLEDVDIVFVPVGGGGLISGISIALKRLKPNVKIIGVQPTGASAMYKSFKTGKLVEADSLSTIADGVAVKKPGELTFKIIREFVDDIVVVNDFEIARAMFFMLERAKLVVEPAGALPVAALLSNTIDLDGKNVVAVISGGNVDMGLLSRIIERGLYLNKRYIKIKGELVDKPGELKKVIDDVAELGLNIISIEHERTNPLIKPGKAEVILGLETPSINLINMLLNKLKRKGIYFKIIE